MPPADNNSLIHAFSDSENSLYTFVAVEGATTADEHASAVSRIIRETVEGVLSNAADFIGLVGADFVAITWVFVVPECDDTQIIKRARRMRERVLAGRPQWCGSQFRIVVCTDAQLCPRELLEMDSATSIHVEVSTPSEDEIDEAVSDEIVERLTEKISVDATFTSDPTRLHEYRDDLLRDYVYGKRQLAALEETFTFAYDAIIRRSNSVFRSLKLAMAAGDGGPSSVLALQDRLAEGIGMDLPNLSGVLREDLARHYVADWMVQCPLEFREAVV